jgi:outer membrane protein assembly factor BamB
LRFWRRRVGILPRWLSLGILSFAVVLLVVSCSGTPAQKGWSGGTLQGNTLYIGSRDGRIISVDISNGSRIWATPLETGSTTAGLGCSRIPIVVTIYGSPAVSDNLVYVGGYNGRVYSFIPGESQPDRTLDRVRVGDKDIPIGRIVGSVVVSDENVYFGADDGKVYGVTTRLQPAWREPFQTGAKIWSTPAVQNGTLYIGSFDKKVYALDASTGEKKWEFLTGGVVTATPVVVNGIVYVGSFDQSFYAIDAASGQRRWQFDAKNGFWATPVVVDGTIYAPALDGKVYVLSAGGEEVAAINLGAPISSSPVLVGKTLVLATEQSPGTASVKAGAAIWAIDTGTNQGRELARLPGDKVYAPLAAGQGSVYVHTDRDALYAVDVTSGALRQFAIK